MKKLIVAVFVIAVGSLVFADTNAFYKDTNNDGKNDVLIIENEFFRITFSPSNGGKATEVFYKPENKLMSVSAGWFQDAVVELGEMVGAKLYDCDHPYASEILKDGPDFCSVKFYSKLPGTGKFENYKNVGIERVYTLYKNSPTINVEVRVKNDSNETLPFTLMLAHWAWVDSEDSWYFVPDELGILNDFDSQVRTFSAPVGSQEPTSNFVGFLSVQSKLGLIFVMEWKYLDAIECWLSKGKGACIQWPYRRQTIQPGQVWETAYKIYPIKEIESIDAADEKYIIGITAGEKSGIGNFVSKEEIQVGKEIPIKIYVSGVADGKVKLEYGYRILPEEKVKILGSKEIKIEKTKGTYFNFLLPVEKKDSTYVIKTILTDEKNNVLEAEKPLKVGDSPYTYFMKPKNMPQSGEKFYGYQIINPPLPSWYEKVDLGIETPHIKWAKPWCNGKLNVLFVNRSDNSPGYWREIWQRCDIEFDTCSLAFDDAKKFPYTANTLKKFLKKLDEKEYDVVFFSALHWNQGFPEYIKDSIFSFVKQGKGIVILADLRNREIYGTLEKYLNENGKKLDVSHLISCMPYKMPEVWGFELGKGRIVVISGSPASGYETISPSLGDWQAEGRWMWIPGWEYGFGLFAKSIIFAGNKESNVYIKKMNGSNEKIEAIIDNNTGKTIDALCLLTVFNAFYQKEENKQEKIKLLPGENRIEINITGPLSDKVHLADLILKDEKGRNLAWGTSKFVITRDISIVAKMNKETSAYRNSEDIKGIFTIENKKERKKVKLAVEVEDSSGRIVYQQQKELELNTGKNEVIIDISKEKMIDIYHDMKVTVMDGNVVLSLDRHIFFVYPERMPLYDDFYLACWGNLEPNPLKIIISARKLKEAGIDYVYSYGQGQSERYVAYKTGHLLMGPPFSCSLKGGYTGNRKADTAKLTYDPPLVPSEQELNQFIEKMSKTAKGYSEWGGVDYIHLDDERDMQKDFDWSERTIEKFRQWLKDTYGTIEKLNKQWDTNYKDWNEVMPVKLADVKDRRNLSQYIDWRTFIGWAIMEYYYKVPAEAAKQGNPRAVVGQHGIYQTSLTIPQDFWEMSKYTPVTGRYNGMIEEWFSSFGVISGQYGGYGVEQATPRHRYHPWRSLFHGGHWAFYYILWNSGTYHQGILSPDQTVHGGYNELSKEEFSDIKNGIGKLFIETNFSSDRICFPYSYASILTSQALGLSRTGNLYSQKTLIENLGYQHRFLSYQQIKDGELIKKGFKVLILPGTICLSEKEISEIKGFVKNGGILIADYLPGVRDEHGKTYENKAPLDEIFGIERNNTELSKVKMKLKLFKSNIFDEKELEMVLAETGIKIVTGKNMAVFENGTPALIINEYGNGRGIYLNLDISDYAGMKGRGVAGEVIEEERAISAYVASVQEIFERILANSGLKKRFEIFDNEKPINAGERFYYVDGDNMYVSYIPDVASDKKVRITTTKKAHIYDVRTRKYIGFTDNFVDTLKPGNVKVYSILSYKVTGIEGKLKNQYRQGENISLPLSIKADAKIIGKHIFRIEIYKDGKNIQIYNKNVVAEKGNAEVIIPLSYNEEKGDYVLIVRDINSGITGSFRFRVI